MKRAPLKTTHLRRCPQNFDPHVPLKVRSGQNFSGRLASEQFLEVPKRILWAVGTTLYGLLFVASPLQASTEVQFIHQAYEQLVALAPVKEGTVAPQTIDNIRSLFDFSLLFSKTTVDIHGQLSPEQYNQLQGLFVSIFIKNISKKGLKVSGKRLTSYECTLKKKTATQSLVALKGWVDQKSLSMTFNVVGAKGEWKIADLAVEDASLSRNYRGQFNRIFRKEGYEGLKNRLEEKNL